MTDENMKGICSNCGYEYFSEEDLEERKFDGNIWWHCPECGEEI